MGILPNTLRAAIVAATATSALAEDTKETPTQTVAGIVKALENENARLSNSVEDLKQQLQDIKSADQAAETARIAAEQAEIARQTEQENISAFTSQLGGLDGIFNDYYSLQLRPSLEEFKKEEIETLQTLFKEPPFNANITIDGILGDETGNTIMSGIGLVLDRGVEITAGQNLIKALRETKNINIISLNELEERLQKPEEQQGVTIPINPIIDDLQERLNDAHKRLGQNVLDCFDDNFDPNNQEHVRQAMDKLTGSVLAPETIIAEKCKFNDLPENQQQRVRAAVDQKAGAIITKALFNIAVQDAIKSAIKAHSSEPETIEQQYPGLTDLLQKMSASDLIALNKGEAQSIFKIEANIEKDANPYARGHRDGYTAAQIRVSGPTN